MRIPFPLRRLYRRFVPRRMDPLLDAAIAPAPLDDAYAAAYRDSLHESERQDPYAAARFEEGRRWRTVIELAGASDGRILDLGSGSGGLTLAAAAAGRTAVSIDAIWSESARLAHRAAGAPFRHVVGDAASLPFREGAFAAIACLDTFEHFADAASAGREAARVLRERGTIVLTTPARLPWMFRRDPHFGIRFLLTLPPVLQRQVAARRGFDQPHHFVDRIYGRATTIESLFPGCRIVRFLKRSRLPGRWFWEALVMRKS